MCTITMNWNRLAFALVDCCTADGRMSSHAAVQILILLCPLGQIFLKKLKAVLCFILKAQVFEDMLVQCWWMTLAYSVNQHVCCHASAVPCTLGCWCHMQQLWSDRRFLGLQMEIDYKAECHSGDAIESLGSSIKEDTNGTGIRR